MKNQTKLLFVLGIVLIFSVMFSHIAIAEQISTKTKSKIKTIEKIKTKSKIMEKTKSPIKSVTNQTKSTSKNDHAAELAKCDKLKSGAEKYSCKKNLELAKKIQDDKAKATPYLIGPVTFYYAGNHIEKTSKGGTILTIYFVVENTGSSNDITMSCTRQGSCNYVLSDGQKEIQYTTNTLVYGTLTLKPNTPRLLEWSFFQGLNYDPAKDYSFKIRESWGSGTIPLGVN